MLKTRETVKPARRVGLLRLFGVVAGETTGSSSLRLIFDFLAESTPVLDDFKLITIVPLGANHAEFTVFLEGAPRPQPHH